MSQNHKSFHKSKSAPELCLEDFKVLENERKWKKIWNNSANLQDFEFCSFNLESWTNAYLFPIEIHKNWVILVGFVPMFSPFLGICGKRLSIKIVLQAQIIRKVFSSFPYVFCSMNHWHFARKLVKRCQEPRKERKKDFVWFLKWNSEMILDFCFWKGEHSDKLANKFYESTIFRSKITLTSSLT